MDFKRPTTALELTPEQNDAVEAIMGWYRVPAQSYYVLAGYAGTGKTTLIAHLRNQLHSEHKSNKVAFCSFTGKAAHVLRQKLMDLGAIYGGDSCSTIHSLIYTPVYDQKEALVDWKLVPDLKANLIVIDEASMVPQKIWNDLCAFGVPILAVGDHGQLPPIDDSFDLMRNPDIKLERIHRQAAENPIIEIAHCVRRGQRIENGHYGSSVVKISRSDEIAMQSIQGLLSRSDADRLVLCGFNKSRVALNQSIRHALGHESEDPKASERVICLKNNYIYGIFNGMQGEIVDINARDEDYYDLTVKFDGDQKMFTGVAVRSQFGHLKTLSFSELREFPSPSGVAGGAALFDWGYAVTVHKAQGSEADQVVLFEERFSSYDDEMWNRWLYTAVTRARNVLYWIGY